MPKIITKKSNVDLDYPICRPSLDLDFTQEVLDPRITFSRGSIGTRVNRNRLIETVSANTPRFDYNPVTGECKGLLIEESRANLFTYSEDFSNSVWAKNNSFINSNVTIAPDGTLTADKLIGNSGVKIRQSTYYQYVSVTSGTTYTFSLFLKAAERRYISMWFDNLNVSQNAYYGASDYIDLQTGTNVTGTAVKIIPYPNGWYRCYVTGTPTVTTATFIFQIAIGTANNYNDVGASNTFKYTGDGTSGIYIWGAQVEQGSFPTSYIPTAASTVTRSADLVDMTGTNFSSWYNQNEGTIYTNNRIPYTPNPNVSLYFLIFGGPGRNYRHSVEQTTANGLVYITQNGTGNGATQYWSTSNSGILPANTNRKTTYSYSSSNNTTLLSGTSNETYAFSVKSKVDVYKSMNILQIGRFLDNFFFLNGTIARFTYYPKKLKDNQLLYLTQ
jgi:hypothetical protein